MSRQEVERLEFEREWQHRRNNLLAVLMDALARKRPIIEHWMSPAGEQRERWGDHCPVPQWTDQPRNVAEHLLGRHFDHGFGLTVDGVDYDLGARKDAATAAGKNSSNSSRAAHVDPRAGAS